MIDQIDYKIPLKTYYIMKDCYFSQISINYSFSLISINKFLRIGLMTLV
jgi:hypothetical protein